MKKSSSQLNTQTQLMQFHAPEHKYFYTNNKVYTEQIQNKENLAKITLSGTMTGSMLLRRLYASTSTAENSLQTT